jgi:asparagine synthase (glutamine-hydrolysing)
MSGICGIVNLDGKPVDPQHLKRIADSGAYQGPQPPSYWIKANAGLAYLTSYADPDQAMNRQPLVNPRRNLILAADVRLDNRIELIRALQTKEFLTGEDNTDPQLLLAAYDCWEEEFQAHIQGAYAAAIWDEQQQTLILLRDRLGERAIYWHQSGAVFSFASEPFQLLKGNLLNKEYNLERILAYIMDAWPDPTWSYFRGIHRLPEAHLLSLTATHLSVRRYWSYEMLSGRILGRHAAVQALSEQLKNAVARRLAQDGETGILLSGGLDSSSVAAQAASLLQEQGRQLYAFTWATQTETDPIDERATSSYFIKSRSNIIEQIVLADRFFPLSRYPEAYLDPNDPETNTYPDLLLQTIETARLCSVRVLMNGVGGDQVAGGTAPELALLRQGQVGAAYRRIQREGLRASLVNLKQTTFKKRAPDWLSEKGRKLLHQASLDRSAVPWKATDSLTNLRVFLLSRPQNAALLERFNRLSNRTGVRITAPWYDLDVVGVIIGLKDAALDPGSSTKSLLKEAMRGQLPQEILTTPPTKGQSSRLRNQGLLGQGRPLLESWLKQSCLSELGLADRDKIMLRYNDAVNHNRPMTKLWLVVTLEAWLRTNMQN